MALCDSDEGNVTGTWTPPVRTSVRTIDGVDELVESSSVLAGARRLGRRRVLLCSFFRGRSWADRSSLRVRARIAR